MILNAGCGVRVMPNTIPVVKDLKNESFAGVALSVRNAETDNAPYDIPTDKGQKLGFIGNRRAWSEQVALAVSSELAWGCAMISPQARLKLAVSLPAVVLVQHGGRYRFDVTVEAESTNGWTRRYTGSAESGLGLFENADDMASRVAGSALSAAVSAMLHDAGFLQLVRTKGINRTARANCR